MGVAEAQLWGGRAPPLRGVSNLGWSGAPDMAPPPSRQGAPLVIDKTTPGVFPPLCKNIHSPGMPDSGEKFSVAN